MTTPLIRCLAAWAAWAAAATLAVAAEPGKLLWQIGQPDKNYAEFAIATNYPAFMGRFGGKPLVFEVGRGDPARDWPFIQPGPVDVWAGNREHPFTIRFPLAEAPRGLFLLRVQLADVHMGSPPVLLLGVGGQTGRFPLRPGGGDASLQNPAAGKPQQVEVALPASFFHQGQNDLVLTAIEGSWIQYDAVTLFNDPSANLSEPDIQSVKAEVTPFFIRQNGQVRRSVNVHVLSTAPVKDLVLRVAAGGETREVRVNGFAGFGGLSQEVSVPDAAEPLEATITAIAGAKSKSATFKVPPGRKWKIFVAASAHTDIGYTDIQPKCVERHNQNTDLALDLMEQYPDFKWNLEVAWQAENYLAARKGERLEQFLRQAKAGRLGIQALYCNILTGLCSHEAGCRLTAFAHSLQTRYGIPCRSAMISDVPTQEATLPMLLAGSGIRYFSSGINNERAYPFTRLQSQCPCWWEGPDGSRVLMMYAPQYAQASQYGLTRSLDAARVAVISQVKNYESRTNYPFDALWLHGALGDNDLLPKQLPAVVQAWNERYEWPKLILAPNAEFFEYIEQRYGGKLPVIRGSAGTFWEDGAGSSARETTLCRNAQEALASAETLLALAQRLQPAAAYPAADLYSAWRNCLLYDEHTWGAHCSISQPESDFSKQQWKIKAQFAVDADREVRGLLAQGTAKFAALVKSDGRSLVVINPASWPRTDVVQVKLPAGASVPDVPACELPEGTLLLVKDVPACGYRVLKLLPVAASRKSAADRAAQNAQGATLESRFYRVSFDPASGAITSVFDKELNRELADPKAPYRIDQYLYVAGGGGSRIVNNERGPEPKLAISVPEKATLRRLRLGDLGERMVIESSAAMAPRLSSEITVWNHLRRVDFVNRLTKTQTYDKEAVYFAFPFAGEQPTFRYECPAGIVNANTEMLPGACLDWFTVQHFVEIESGDATIAWATPDAPLVCFQDLNRGQWLRSLPMKTGHLYAYVMNNYWYTNYKPGQGGEHVFRFSITSRAKADRTASAQFGWAASNPLLAVPAEGTPGAGLLPAESASLVEIAEPNVLLLGAKQSETGDGLVLRLWETSGQSATAHVRLNHLPARAAVKCNLVEEPQGDLEINDHVLAVPLRGSGLATVLVK
jgi:hypothetical protein